MNEQQLAAVKQALEALKECRCDPRLKYEHPFYDKVITDLEQAIAQNALDKMAENAREVGLDYEPAPVQEGRDWSLLEATQESLREHMAEIKRLKAAQPAPVQKWVKPHPQQE
jgi:type II secretory pathway component PulM